MSAVARTIDDQVGRLMDQDKLGPNGTQRTFLASLPATAMKFAPPRTGPSGSVGGYIAAPVRVAPAIAWDSKGNNRAFALVIWASIALVIIPEIINHLILKHVPDLSIEKALISAESPLSGLSRWALSGVLLLVSSLVALRPGHPNRDITWLLVFLLALNLPYVIGLQTPAKADLIKLVVANIVLVAIWNTGARLAELKWIPILATCVGAYSIIGGFIIPEYMMYNMVSRKSLIGGWELAGPFGQSNSLGLYCSISFTLIPLIPRKRWRVICAVILLATIVASASRSSVTAALFVLLWWTLSSLRPVISIRLVGTFLAALAMSAAFAMPLLHWSPDAFTGRALIWAESLLVWQKSPIVGMGFNWFQTTAQWAAETVVWAGPGTGHNILVDNLVKTGLAGVATLMAIWIPSVFAVRATRVTNEQIAFFGFLIGYFVLAMTEASWSLWPNIQQFPTSGLIFATLLLTRDREPSHQM